MVQAPGFFTLTAALVRIAWSRSVAVMFSRSPSASIRKLDRMGMVVLRSTTLCVAVSSFTSSWRLTVISIAAPCATDCSTSVSTIDIDLPPPSILQIRESYHFRAGHTLQQLTAPRKRPPLAFFLIVFILGAARAWKTGLLLAIQRRIVPGSRIDPLRDEFPGS